MRAMIALEDGTVLEGRSFGAPGERAGELVFNTSMSGYQEVLTDPSYSGQIVIMTYPLIGNYGVNAQDSESRAVHVQGLVVRQASRVTSNWRSQKTLQDYLGENNVPAIEDVDTRLLTRRIRTAGAMRAVVSTVDLDRASLVAKAQAAPSLVGRDLVKQVTCKHSYVWGEPVWNAESHRDPANLRVVVVDCGAKFSILRLMRSAAREVVVVPASTGAEEILAQKPDGVIVSNGPGDPAAVPYVYQTLRYLIGRVPIFGICLGHQMLGLALGGQTRKLKFGHHGANHPVMDYTTGKVEITSQNHNFVVDYDTLDGEVVRLTHLNLNDSTCEGLQHKKHPVFSVQYHPEASPGPQDSRYLFERFVSLMQST